MSKRRFELFELENLPFWGALLLSGFVILFDFLGILGDFPWLSERVPTVTLLLLSFIAGTLLVERRKSLAKLETSIDSKTQYIQEAITLGTTDISNLIRSEIEKILVEVESGNDDISRLIKDGDAQLFNNPEETYSYFVKRLNEAEISIDVTHFDNSPFRKGRDDQNDYLGRSSYYETLSKIIKEGKVKVRRIQLVRDRDNFEWMKEILEEFNQCPRFSLGCYVGNASDIPLISLMIIDGQEVCLAAIERKFSDEQKTISIKNSIFIQVIQEHMKNLWRHSIIVKKEWEVKTESINDIENKINDIENKINDIENKINDIENKIQG